MFWATKGPNLSQRCMWSYQFWRLILVYIKFAGNWQITFPDDYREPRMDGQSTNFSDFVGQEKKGITIPDY